MSIAERFITHAVENQPPPLAPYNAYLTDRALRDAVAREGGAWGHADQRGAHVVRAAISFLHGQPEQGNGCPLTMTYAAVPALRHEPRVAEAWVPRITSLEYDARVLPAAQKRGCTVGMGMTE